MTKDRRVRVQRRETNLMDSLYNPTLLDFAPVAGSSAGKVTFPSEITLTLRQPQLSLSLDLEHLSQVLLSYFKQLHGEQPFSEVLFRLPLFTEASLSIKDLLRRSPFPVRVEPTSSSIQGDLDFIRRAIQLPIVEPLDHLRLQRFVNMSINALHTALTDVQQATPHEEILHDVASITIKLGDLIRNSSRLDNARHLFLNYHLLLALTLTRGIEQLTAQNAVHPLLVHLVGILMYSTRELIQDLSTDPSVIARPLVFEDLHQVFNAAERYHFLRQFQTLKVFLLMLHRWVLSSSPPPVRQRSSIPDAPPLPSDLVPVETPADDTFNLDNLFDEKINTAAALGPTSKSSIYRSLSISHRKRSLLNRYLDFDVPATSPSNRTIAKI